MSTFVISTHSHEPGCENYIVEFDGEQNQIFLK
jgi:hypothetical protein